MAFFFLKIIKFGGCRDAGVPFFILQLQNILIFYILYILSCLFDLVPHFVVDKEWLVFAVVDAPYMYGPYCCAVVGAVVAFPVRSGLASERVSTYWCFLLS